MLHCIALHADRHHVQCSAPNTCLPACVRTYLRDPEQGLAWPGSGACGAAYVSCVCCVNECLVGVYILSLSVSFFLAWVHDMLWMPVTSLSSLPPSLPPCVPILPPSKRGAHHRFWYSHPFHSSGACVCAHYGCCVGALSGWGGTSALTDGLMKGKKHTETTLRD